jgi:hypothetical protein
MVAKVLTFCISFRAPWRFCKSHYASLCLSKLHFNHWTFNVKKQSCSCKRNQFLLMNRLIWTTLISLFVRIWIATMDTRRTGTRNMHVVTSGWPQNHNCPGSSEPKSQLPSLTEHQHLLGSFGKPRSQVAFGKQD